MQEIEKVEILTKLEELNLYINEKPLNHIGIQISKFNEILYKYKILQNFYKNHLTMYKTIISDSEKRELLVSLYDYIKYFSQMEMCKNFIPEIDKTSADGTLSTLFYSNAIISIVNCIIGNQINIFAMNFDGIINFYCKIISYACGSLINQSLNTDKMLEIQHDLQDLERNLNIQLCNTTDFKVLNFSKDNLDFSSNSEITNKIYSISLSKVIKEIKIYIKSIETELNTNDNKLLLNNLSNAENELFNYLIKGYTISKISSMMNKSSNTLKTQQQSIFSKLNVNSKNELIEKFTQNG